MARALILRVTGGADRAHAVQTVAMSDRPDLVALARSVHVHRTVASPAPGQTSAPYRAVPKKDPASLRRVSATPNSASQQLPSLA